MEEIPKLSKYKLNFKKTNILKETFGTLKFKKTTDEILKEIEDEDL